ncbi:MAG: spermidine/putrescine ABC transporter substrate-binding protein [Actinomycetota bacterium]
MGVGVPILQACGSGSTSAGKRQTKTIADGLQPEKGPLRILNYDAYVNPDVIKDFEAKFGVKVEITTFTTDTEALTKLASGAVKVDLHHSMAATSINRLIDGGLLQPLNKSYLSNSANVVSKLQDPWYDKGSTYSVPYTYFGTGIGYRADKIDKATVEQQGWDALWKATSHKGKVSVLDDEREALIMAMLRKGVTDINTVDPTIINQAQADLSELINLVSVKVNIDAYKNLPDGTAEICHTWSSDLINAANGYLPTGAEPTILGYWHPPAGKYMVTNDSMGVLANAEHPVLAHLYLNFLLDNAVAEKNFTFTGYLPALTKLDADYVVGKGLVPENLRNCVPTKDEIDQAIYERPLTTDGDALYEAAWSKFTAGG